MYHENKHFGFINILVLLLHTFTHANFFQYMVTGRRPVKPCSAVLLKKHCTWLEINPGILIWYLASSRPHVLTHARRNTVTIEIDTPSSTFFVFYKYKFNYSTCARRARYHGCSCMRNFNSLGKRVFRDYQIIKNMVRGTLVQ